MCRCCGFRSERYQRAVPGSSVPGANDFLLTLCLFCDLCFAVDRAGMASSGVLVWLPEIGQAELHHIMRAIYVAKSSGNATLAAAALRAQDALMSRRSEARKRLGSEDPLLLATAFYECLNDAEYEVSRAKLEGVRLLPLDRLMVHGRQGDVNQFPRIVAYWTSPGGPYAKLPVESWLPLFDSLTAQGSLH